MPKSKNTKLRFWLIEIQAICKLMGIQKDKIGYEPPQQQWMQQPAIQDMIMQARKKRVTENVLDKAIINKPATATHAHEKGNSDWRYLCTASLF